MNTINTHTFHPIHHCNDGKFNTLTSVVDITNPTTDMINIHDIANALSKINRFGGHTNRFYSVAQHSVLVAMIVPKQYKLEALLHDATEAYLGDVIKPLKILLGNSYRMLELSFEAAIYRKYNVSSTAASKQQIKKADEQMLELEHEALQKGNTEPLLMLMKNLGVNVDGHCNWQYNTAKVLFKSMFAECISTL
jgi:uncharacterized protein